MSNIFKVTDLVAKESLRIAHEKLQFIGTVDRQYDESFAMKGRGSPHGSTLRVKNPNQYTRRTGSAMAVQAQNETSQTITVATLDGVDMGFNQQELVQSVDNDGAFDQLSKNYIQPAISSLCSAIEADFIAFASKATANVVGTAGTGLTDLVVPGAARARLNQNAAPKDGQRYIQCESVTMGGLVNGLKGLFQDSQQIKEQYREGMIGRTAMADWYENDRMWTMTTGSDVSGTLNTYTVVNGDTSVTLTSVTGVAVGMVFTIAGAYACHPETKQSLGYLKQFVVTAASDSAPTFSPAIYFQNTGANAALQNVVSVSGAVPAISTTAAVVFVGTASKSYVQNLMYHKEAYQFVTASLPILDDAQRCVVVKKDDLSLRAWMGSDIRNNELLMRIDILYGMAALKPEWGCRMIGAEAA